MLRVVLRQNGFGRWIITPEGDPNQAWSGGRFVPVDTDGFGITVQIANWSSHGGAMVEARLLGFEVVNA